MYSSHFQGETGEAGEPNQTVNPSAPPNSRAAGDPFVHYIVDGVQDKTLIRFWFPEIPAGKVMPVDFEVLAPIASWLKDKPLTLTFDVAAKLILMVFFQECIDDYYSGKVDTMKFRQLDNSTEKEIPYPNERISKHGIA